MDKINELVDELGVRDLGDFEGSVFVINFNSSDEFSNIYTQISDRFDADDNAGEFNDSKSMVVFTDEDLEIITTADYDNDVYSISIGEK